MSRQFLNVEERQSMGRKNAFNSDKRKIGKVFMVNRVELVFLHEPHQMRKLEGDDPVLVEQNLHPADKTIQIRYMGENIVPDDQIRMSALRRQITCGVLTEETDQRRNTSLNGRLGYIARRAQFPKPECL